MNAPDKIYLWRTGDYISKGWKQKQKNINHEIEYIRKDALLVWAKERMGRLEALFKIAPSSAVAGKYDAMKELIEKIESL